MTENEAITRFDFIRRTLLGGTKLQIMQSYENIALIDAAIEALEEVQQYRAIGTVEELIRGKMYMDIAKRHGTIGRVIDECVAYETIGTPEECLQYKDFLDFLSDKMNPNDFETYLRMYNSLEEKGRNEE